MANQHFRRRRWCIETLESRWNLAGDHLDIEPAADPAEVVDTAPPADAHDHNATARHLHGQRQTVARRLTERPSSPVLRATATRAARIPASRVARPQSNENAISLAAAPAAGELATRGDLNGDGPVDRTDVAIMARNYGRIGATPAQGDLSGDLRVGLGDLKLIALGPGPFNIVSPPAKTVDHTPQVTWTAALGATLYDVWIQDYAGCDGIFRLQYWSDISATSVTADTLDDGVYYVCAEVQDEAGNYLNAANNNRRFEIGPPAPDLNVRADVYPTQPGLPPIVSVAGTVLYYNYYVENTGNVPLTSVTLSDSRGLSLTRGPDAPGNNDGSLDAGEAWLLHGTYTVTQADIDAKLSLVSTGTVDSAETPADTVESRVVISLFTGEIVGDMVIRPIDHASFVMSWHGVVIYSDPVGGAGLYAGLPPANVALVTHGHGDHFSSSTLSAVGNVNTSDAIPDMRIIAPQAVHTSMSTTLKNVTTIVNNDMNVNVLGLNVAAVPAYNTNHPRGTGNAGNGYVLTLGPWRVYISGDTGAAAEIRALDDIDLAFVCMNVPFTMNVTDAASVVRDIDPGVVYPYHYRNSGGTFADLNQFRTLVGTDLGIEVRLGDWY